MVGFSFIMLEKSDTYSHTSWDLASMLLLINLTLFSHLNVKISAKITTKPLMNKARRFRWTFNYEIINVQIQKQISFIKQHRAKYTLLSINLKQDSVTFWYKLKCLSCQKLKTYWFLKIFRLIKKIVFFYSRQICNRDNILIFRSKMNETIRKLTKTVFLKHKFIFVD